MDFSMPCCKKAGKVEAVKVLRQGLFGWLAFMASLALMGGLITGPGPGTGTAWAADAPAPNATNAPGAANPSNASNASNANSAPAAATSAAASSGAGIEINEVRLERGDDQILLSATLRLELPPLVMEAAEKGIPLYFVAEANVLKKRWYWYDKQVSAAHRYYRLAFQPLTRRWRLQVSNTPINYSGLGVTLGQSFDDLDAALASVRRIANWKIGPSKDVAADGKEELNFSFKLDVSQLPRPFQFGVSDRADWNLSANQTLLLTPESLR
jgi:hypothetical protein